MIEKEEDTTPPLIFTKKGQKIYKRLCRKISDELRS